MRVISFPKNVGPGTAQEVGGKVVFELNGVELDVRQSTDGTCLIVAVRQGKVSMEPRAAAIWLVVKP